MIAAAAQAQKAADYIREHGWIQGNAVSPSGACSEGAIGLAMGGRPVAIGNLSCIGVPDNDFEAYMDTLALARSCPDSRR